MKKVTSLKQIISLASSHKRLGKQVGLITGCFDILHAGHIELFRYAKKHVDILLVGLENDETIRLSKGANRPVHSFAQRSLVTSELISVDYLFKIPITVTFGALEAVKQQYTDMVRLINPDYLITTPKTDKYWTQKRDSLIPLGIKVLKYSQKQSTSTSFVLNHIQKEI